MYPDDKETFDRAVNRKLPEETGTILNANNFVNPQSSFLERLQDTLGLGIKMGYGTVKLFFDWIVTKFGTTDTAISDLNTALDDKANVSGDTFSGECIFNGNIQSSTIKSIDTVNQYLRGARTINFRGRETENLMNLKFNPVNLNKT